MRYIFSILLCGMLQTGFSQIIKTVGISYTNGTPTYTPAKAGSALALDTVTWRYYTWNGSTWISDGFRVQTISGCSAPNYTPTKYQSHLVINACTAMQGGPELYYWLGSAWVKAGGNVYTEGTGIDITGGVITNTAPNVVQTLSIAGQDLTLSGGGGTVTLPGGRDSTLAGNGLSMSDKTIQIGNTVGGTSAQLSANRYIPTNDYALLFGNNAGTSYVQISGDSTSSVGHIRHRFPSSPNAAYIRSIAPIVKGTQNMDFYEGVSSNAQSGNSPNAVWMMGWNLSPGGGKVESGKPYIGESWESNFRISAPTVYPRLIEKHEIYMPSYNSVQRRLSSYTIQESSVGANFIDYYHTVDAFSLRDTSGNTYFSARGNNASLTAKVSASFWSAGNRALSVTVDSTNNTFVITNNSLVATKSTSNFVFSGFREYNFNDYLGRSVLRSVTSGGGNNVEFGTTSYATEHHFRTNSIFGAYGVYIEADVNTQTSLATRGNLSISSGSNRTWMGQRSDINMFYIATSGALALRSTSLQVGPSAGTSLPSAAALHVLGGGATSSTYSLIVTNSGGTTSTAAIAVRDDNTVGFGTNAPAASAKVEISSTTQGLLPPRMTTAQRNAIASPATGLTLYCTDCTAADASTGVMQTWNGAAWKNNW